MFLLFAFKKIITQNNIKMYNINKIKQNNVDIPP